MNGHKSYIGSVIAPLLQSAGYTVIGLDSYLFDGCAFGDPPAERPALMNVSGVREADLKGLRPLCTWPPFAMTL